MLEVMRIQDIRITRLHFKYFSLCQFATMRLQNILQSIAVLVHKVNRQFKILFDIFIIPKFIYCYCKRKLCICFFLAKFSRT